MVPVADGLVLTAANVLEPTEEVTAREGQPAKVAGSSAGAESARNADSALLTLRARGSPRMHRLTIPAFRAWRAQLC